MCDRTFSWSAMVLLLILQPACSRRPDISFFVLVKSSNYSQDSQGKLTLLNYHFFSEIFLASGRENTLVSATLTVPGNPRVPMSYESRGDNYYFEGGHFDTLEEADNVYVNGTYSFDITSSDGRQRRADLVLAGPGGQSDIPAPITISFLQEGEAVPPVAIDPSKDLLVRWSEYSNGRADPRGVVDDMIFVVVADCHGERLFHTGLPFQGEYTTFRTTEVVVEAGTLDNGHPYSAFVEFPHVVDSRIVDGVPGFTSYATATYIDLRTTGPATDESCPPVAPPMDTGQIDRMEEVRVPSR